MEAVVCKKGGKLVYECSSTILVFRSRLKRFMNRSHLERRARIRKKEQSWKTLQTLREVQSQPGQLSNRFKTLRAFRRKIPGGKNGRNFVVLRSTPWYFVTLRSTP